MNAPQNPVVLVTDGSTMERCPICDQPEPCSCWAPAPECAAPGEAEDFEGGYFYSRGKNRFDNQPALINAGLAWEQFVEKVWQDKSAEKGSTFVAAPFIKGLHNDQKKNPGVARWRQKHLAARRRWVPFDVDEMADKGVLDELRAYLGGRYQALIYTTDSSTEENPRVRMLVDASRAMKYDECVTVALAIEGEIITALGDGRIKFDQSVYKGEQPCYLPTVRAKRFDVQGKPVDVDALLNRGGEGRKASTAAPAWEEDGLDTVAQETGLTIEECRRILDLLPEHRYDDRDKWLLLIFAVHHEFYRTEFELDALEMVDDWSAQSVKFVTGVVAAIWEKAKRERAGGLVTMRTVLHWLRHEDGKEAEWKAYQAERKAAASAAVAVAQDWESQIKQAPDAATLEKVAAQVRATPSLSEGTIATLAGLAGARCKVLNIDLRAARWKKLMTPRAKATHPASVDLADFIPYGLPEPELNPSIFPHVEYTETTIRVKNTLANAARMLEAYGITAYYDGIKKKPVINIPGASACRDQADNVALARIESLGNLNGMAGEKAARFAATVAYENQRNLIGDWIKSAPWDGQDRIAQLCNTLTVRPDFPQDLRNLIVRRWLISAVAAALKPAGFYSKGVLTLQGEQSIGKTAWVGKLVPSHLDDYVLLGAHLDPHNRDSIKTAVSHWIVELGEVDSTMSKAESGALKAFINQRTDKLRLPYALADSEFQRRTVFAASVNPEEFLKDETGNVRWWTLPVTAIDSQHGIDLQQLWAQVAAAYEGGEKWWLVSDEERRLERCNSQHTVKSSIHEILADALDFEAPRTEWARVTATGVLQTVLAIKVPTNAQAREAGAALRALLGKPTMSKGHPGWWVPPAKFERAAGSAFDD